MISNETINRLLRITETYQAPEKLMFIILNDLERVALFLEFLEVETDIEYEWFQQYFEEEQSARKNLKQDFTPNSVATLMSQLINQGNTYYECAAGTGTLLIKHWSQQRRSVYPWDYDPRSYWYQVEELSDRALPFLLFNMSIRGMNGVVLHGDSLSRKFKDVYFIRNDSSDFQVFSEVIKMPHSEELRKELNIVEWE